jgi:hypothetical protein
MEEMLAIEAEAKYLLAASDRSYEQNLMQELSRILNEAELLFGPRDTSYQLSIPRITECATSRTYILRPLRMTRIYLSRDSRIKPWIASLELAHEAIHILSPGASGTDFQSYWRTPSPWSGFATEGAERIAACLRTIWK